MLSSIKSLAAKNPLSLSKPAPVDPAISHLDREKDGTSSSFSPPPLDQEVALVTAIAASIATSQTKQDVRGSSSNEEETEVWLKAVCENLQLDPSFLPPSPTEADLVPMLPHLPRSQSPLVTHTLLLSSIFPPKHDASSRSTSAPPADAAPNSIAYTSTSRANVFRTLSLLGIDPREIVVRQEEMVAAELFELLKKSSEADEGKNATDKDKEEVERARKAKEDGWGGKWGRWAATGAGVVIGGVAIGLTGGLAAPAILALLPATIGILSPAAAPLLLGSFFGLAGGGLAGRRVNRRWAGVGEFEFVEVGREDENASEKKVVVPYEVRKKKGAAVETEVEKEEEEIVSIPPRPPSLTVVIALPGLLVDDQEEGVKAWTNVASSLRAGPAGVVPVEAEGQEEQEEFELLEAEEKKVHEIDGDEGALLLRGRDLYVAKVETLKMLSSGQSINSWITNKLIGKAGREVIKRTFVNAYFAAVALPLIVYGWAGAALDNSWMQAVDKSRKAGSVLATVLLSRIQGSRPVVLIGTSVGALTIFHALLELASSPNPIAKELVDSAILISMPSAPSGKDWQTARSVAGRRMVSGHSRKDFVLASVVRLHEVVGGAVEARLDGGKVAGLGAVNVEGVEDVDLSGVVDGHFDINKKLPEILRIIDLDA